MCSVGGNQFLGQFLLLDIGSPMNSGCVKMVKESLLNVLSLASCLHGVSRIPVFGCGILDSDLHIIYSWDFLIANYCSIESRLGCLEENTNIGVTVPDSDYIRALASSIAKIVNDFDSGLYEWRCQTKTKNKFDVHYYWPKEIQITIITKKSIYPIAEVIKENRVLGPMVRLKTLQLIELTTCKDNEFMCLGKTMNIILCNIVAESEIHLDECFKTWLLVNQRNREHLRIIINEEYDFHIKCDLNDCILNPVNLPLSQDFTLSGNFPTLITQKPLVMNDYKTPVYQLVVTSRIAISDLCPSLLFGFPQRIYPTQSFTLTWDESQKNIQLFGALCRQLYEMDLGILAKIKESSPGDQISTFHFIISDGEKLLMKNLVPTELKLPPRPVTLPSVTQSSENVEQEACRTVCSFLNQISVMHDYSPNSIGIYDRMRKHVISQETANTSLISEKGSPAPSKIKRKGGKKDGPSYLRAQVTRGEYTPPFLTDAGTSSANISQSIPNSITTTESATTTNQIVPTHPALMSPAAIAKHRKRNSSFINLPEWSEPGIEEK